MKNRFSAWLVIVVTSSVASGCGGGGGGGGGESSTSPTFDELLAEYQANEAAINASSTFAATSLPTMGDAIYDGPFFIRTSTPTIEMWGEMTLEIDLTTNKVNGGVENFRRPDETPLTGSLTLIEDDILRTQPTPLTAKFADTRLTEPGVTYDVENLQVTGRFFGPTGELMTGIVTGQVVWDNTPASINDGITLQADGDYAIERVD